MTKFGSEGRSALRPLSASNSDNVMASFTVLRQALWGVGGISMVINLLMLTGPLFMLQVYDRVLVGGSMPTLVTLAGLALALYLFYGALEAMRGRVLLRIAQRVDTRMSGDVFALSTTLPMRRDGDGAIQRPVDDLDALTRFLSGGGPSAIFDLPWLPFYLGLVFLFHITLGFVALAGVLVLCALIALNEALSKKPAIRAARATARRAAFVEESRRNAEAVRAMGMLDALLWRWHGDNAEFLDDQRGAADTSAAFGASIRTIRFILQSAVLAVGAWLTILQEMSPGAMIACSIMTSRALSPIEQAIVHWRGLIAARQALARLRNLFAVTPDSIPATRMPLPTRSLSVESLHSCPPGARRPVVHNVGFTLAAGDGLAILGPSGSGKTTLARTLVGTANIASGAVRFDGSELDRWSPSDRGCFIGYLPQDAQLFDGTIARNIARFAPDASADGIIEAANLADIHTLISALPDGYDTHIGVGGSALSGGQRQRIALARALYGNPFLVVLDEPNANLDPEGEAALARAIVEMRSRGSIVVVIAHRPRAIGAVDTVMCLDDGRVSAFGPRDAVMRQLVTAVPERGAA